MPETTDGQYKAGLGVERMKEREVGGSASEPAALTPADPHVSEGDACDGTRVMADRAVAWRRLRARLTPSFGYGRCLHCGSTWRSSRKHRRPHLVSYAPSRAVFFACEFCWPRTTPAERLAYAGLVAGHWEEWASVATAVRAASEPYEVTR